MDEQVGKNQIPKPPEAVSFYLQDKWALLKNFEQGSDGIGLERQKNYSDSFVEGGSGRGRKKSNELNTTSQPHRA